MSYLHKYLVAILLMFVSLNVTAQTFTDPALAFDHAHTQNKPVLVIFEGSDWCIPCIRMEKKIISTKAFQDFAGNNIIMLKADFPQRKKIAPGLTTQYEKLASEFNKEGIFPKMILLNANQKAISVIGTVYNKPEELISKIQQELKRYHEKM